MPKIGRIEKVLINPKNEELTGEIVIDKSKVTAEFIKVMKSGKPMRLIIKGNKAFLEALE